MIAENSDVSKVLNGVEIVDVDSLVHKHTKLIALHRCTLTKSKEVATALVSLIS